MTCVCGRNADLLVSNIGQDQFAIGPDGTQHWSLNSVEHKPVVTVLMKFRSK